MNRSSIERVRKTTRQRSTLPGKGHSRYIVAAQNLDPPQGLSNRKQSKIHSGPAPLLLPPARTIDSIGPCRSAAINPLSCGDAARFGLVERSCTQLCQGNSGKPLTSDSATTCTNADAVECRRGPFSAVQSSGERSPAPICSPHARRLRRAAEPVSVDIHLYVSDYQRPRSTGLPAVRSARQSDQPACGSRQPRQGHSR
jgi:hypothetical protein